MHTIYVYLQNQRFFYRSILLIAKCWIQALIGKRKDRKTSKILKPIV